jgi:predicted nucleic acid-binding protein
LALTLYLDTSVLAGFFVETDAFAGRANSLFAGMSDVPIVSDFVAAEFASVIARLTRTGRITADEARETFALFDNWRAQSADDADAEPTDIQTATAIIRRLNLNLRAPDAINLAIAMRLNASIATFDHGLIANAHALGVAVAAA